LLQKYKNIWKFGRLFFEEEKDSGVADSDPPHLTADWRSTLLLCLQRIHRI